MLQVDEFAPSLFVIVLECYINNDITIRSVIVFFTLCCSFIVLHNFQLKDLRNEVEERMLGKLRRGQTITQEVFSIKRDKKSMEKTLILI